MARFGTMLNGLRLSILNLVLMGCASDSGLVASANKFEMFASNIEINGEATMSLSEALDHYDMDGLSVVALENGIISGFAFHGIADYETGEVTDQDTIYQAASLSKIVVGLGMAKAHRLGTIDLDVNVPNHIMANQGQHVHAWYTREFLGNTKKRWAEQVSMRRLLQSNAGMTLKATGTACNADETSIENFLGSFTSGCVDCVEIDFEPGSRFRYSSGGFVVAEAMFEESSRQSSRKFLNDEVLDAYGLDSSTFKNASSKIDHLAAACDKPAFGSALCECRHEIAKIKFPGGMLANPLDYARLLMLILHDGKEPTGEGVIPRSDIRTMLLPGHHKDSSLAFCRAESDCSNDELCIAAQCMDPLGQGDDWYGFGVHMKPELASDGYPKELYHKGGHDGFSNYFNIDRSLQNGLVVFVNGPKKSDRNKLRQAIVDAFELHYRAESE